jgi:ABC-type lipoprotein export system ATPase subunit
MTILAKIAEDPGRGVLVVTHDPRILPFAHRVIHIQDGRIVGEEPGGAQRTPLTLVGQDPVETVRRVAASRA